MNITVGSIESSDIKLEIHPDNHSLRIRNMVPEIEDELIERLLTEILESTGVAAHHPVVYFNGANKWVIESRCEALLSMLEGLRRKEGEPLG